MRRRALLIAAAVGMLLAVPGVSGAQAPAGQDSVHFTGGPAEAGVFFVRTIDATSGPSGESPTGQVGFNVVPIAFEVSGPVTCLAVSGNTATINFQDESPGNFGIVTVEVVDSQPDTFVAVPTGRAPTDCSPLEPIYPRYSLSGGDITVVDAPPLPTSTSQCKQGGWRQFGFKNQGECVASVNRGLKP